MNLDPPRTQKQQRPKFTRTAMVLFPVVLLLPSMASVELSKLCGPRFVCGYLATISVITFWLYWDDKRRAERDDWRTQESSLHVFELLGGWPAAFLAQRLFRHKIRKRNYQIAFWLIVTLHQLVCFDYLLQWRYTHRLLLVLTNNAGS